MLLTKMICIAFRIQVWDWRYQSVGSRGVLSYYYYYFCYVYFLYLFTPSTVERI